MLNPDNNLYSVAPVGSVIMIGRNATLRYGLSRENALNLLTWLVIATNATPEEIRAGIRAAVRPDGSIPLHGTPVVNVPLAGTSVGRFIGDVDAEEKATMEAVASVTPIAPVAPAKPSEPTGDVVKTWTGEG